MAYKLQTIRSGAVQHPENMIDFLTVKMIGTSGVFDKDNGDLKVKQKPAPSMAILVAMGAAWIRKSDGSMVYPVNLETEDAEIAVAANASGNPRIDAVVLFIDLAAAPNTTATNVAKIQIVQGAPAASPAAPSDAAIAASIGAANPFIRLANIAVATGAATITDANITDTRANIVMADVFNQDFETGDVKSTFKSTVAGRWLKMDGKTIGNAASTADYKGDQYKALFDHLVSLGYTPTASWAANGKIVVPDGTDKFEVGAGSTYGLGTSGGTNTHQHTTGDLTLDITHLPSHNHGGTTGNDSPDHVHYDAGHNHLIPIKYDDQDGSGSNGVTNGGSNIWTNTGYASIGGASARHTHGITAQGGGLPHNHGATNVVNHVPKYIAVNRFIKY